MTYKKYFLVFTFSFLITVLIYLSFDLKADYEQMTGVALFSSVTFSLFLLNFEKKLTRWYMENFDKNYRCNKQKPLLKKNLKDGID